MGHNSGLLQDGVWGLGLGEGERVVVGGMKEERWLYDKWLQVLFVKFDKRFISTMLLS